jgi:hypothetical protein
MNVITEKLFEAEPEFEGKPVKEVEPDKDLTSLILNTKEEDDDDFSDFNLTIDNAVNPETGKVFTPAEYDEFWAAKKNIDKRRKKNSPTGAYDDKPATGRKRLSPQEKEQRDKKIVARHMNFVAGDETAQRILAKKDPVDVNKIQLFPKSWLMLKSQSNELIDNFIKKTPKYKIINKQIELINKEYNTYNKLGDEEAKQKCVELIMQLKGNKQSFEKLFKTQSNEEREKTSKAIKASPKIKELNAEIKKGLDTIRDYSVNIMIKELSRFRKALFNKDELKDTGIELSFDDFDENEESSDIDMDLLPSAEFSEDEKKLETEYFKFINKIAHRTGVSHLEIEKSSLVKIRELLKLVTPDLQPLKDKIRLLRKQKSYEIKKIKGANDLVDVMFDLFDYTDPKDEKKSKALLAASNVQYVTTIAYNICSKNNKLHLLDDAIADGMLALAIAINSWYNTQRYAEDAVSFEGFSYITIGTAIQKGLYGATSGGKITGTSMATLLHKRLEFIKVWKRAHPEFKDLPFDILDELAASAADENELELPGRVIPETEIKQIIGGDDESGEIWDNLNPDDGINIEAIKSENQKYYSKLIESIRQLFDLFSMKYNANADEYEMTDKKIFDKYDYYLFMYHFGFIRKKDENGIESDKLYTQKEIAELIFEMKKQDKIPVEKPMSQPAIKTRIDVMNKKLKEISETRPEIKQGLQYLWNYWKTNFAGLQELSNEREKLNVKINKDMLDTYLDQHPQQKRRILDNTNLNNIYDFQSDEDVTLPSEIEENVRKLFFKY